MPGICTSSRTSAKSCSSISPSASLPDSAVWMRTSSRASSCAQRLQVGLAVVDDQEIRGGRRGCDGRRHEATSRRRPRAGRRRQPAEDAAEQPRRPGRDPDAGTPAGTSRSAAPGPPEPPTRVPDSRPPATTSGAFGGRQPASSAGDQGQPAGRQRRAGATAPARASRATSHAGPGDLQQRRRAGTPRACRRRSAGSAARPGCRRRSPVRCGAAAPARPPGPAPPAGSAAATKVTTGSRIDRHRRRAATRSGSRSVKVLPQPGSLATAMRAPSSSVELAADRQAEARAAEAPRDGAVGLGERREQRRQQRRD